MNAWWRGLNARERALVLAGTLVLAGGGFYAGVWDPLASDTATLRARVDALTRDAAWMRDALMRLPAAGTARTEPDPRPLPSLVEQEAAAAGLAGALKSLDAGTDGRVSVRFEEVGFDALAAWLEALAVRGVRIERAEIDRGAEPGQVAARLTFGKR